MPIHGYDGNGAKSLPPRSIVVRTLQAPPLAPVLVPPSRPPPPPVSLSVSSSSSTFSSTSSSSPLTLMTTATTGVPNLSSAPSVYESERQGLLRKYASPSSTILPSSSMLLHSGVGSGSGSGFGSAMTMVTGVGKRDEEEEESLSMGRAIRKMVPPSALPTLTHINARSRPLRPKTGSGVVLIHPPPQFLATVVEEPEPMIPPRAGLHAEMQAHDLQKLQPSAKLMNRLVYDSMEPNTDGDLKIFGRQGIYRGKLESNLELSKEGSSDGSEAESVPLVSNLGCAGSASGKVVDEVVDLPPYYKVRDPRDTTLVFESRFESGNLRRAVQVYEFEYDLILKFDVNSRGHTQWFFFSIANVRKDVRYKFNVINLLKPASLYNLGMRPLLYSLRHAKESGVGWTRSGFDICYYQNRIKKRCGFYYTLTFSAKFSHDDDTVYFAYSYPYTYTNLQEYLLSIEQDHVRRTRSRRRVLCHSLAGNNCDMLTITSFTSDPESLRRRKGVVISARVHPGESNSSWMMKGVLDYLTGPSLDAKILRDNFIFKVVPMLNPDGVVNGNYRCSLAGMDLNRRWMDPSRKLNPTIFAMKTMMKRFSEDREIVLFCDLHGHSRKQNIFMYGCCNKDTPELHLKERIFPRLLAEMANSFSFLDCNFRVQRSKESTARVVGWREIGILNSLTMEASFAGSTIGARRNCHFNQFDLEEMGHALCDALLEYCQPDQSHVNAVFEDLLETMTLNPSLEDAGNARFLVDDHSRELGERVMGHNTPSAGSDDAPSEGSIISSSRTTKKKKKRRKGKKIGKSQSSSSALEDDTSDVPDSVSLAQSALSRVQSLPPSSMIVNGEEINCSPPLKSARQASRSGLNLLRALDPTPHTTARFLIREMQNQEVSVAAAACQSELDIRSDFSGKLTEIPIVPPLSNFPLPRVLSYENIESMREVPQLKAPDSSRSVSSARNRMFHEPQSTSSTSGSVSVSTSSPRRSNAPPSIRPPYLPPPHIPAREPLVSARSLHSVPNAESFAPDPVNVIHNVYIFEPPLTQPSSQSTSTSVAAVSSSFATHAYTDDEAVSTDLKRLQKDISSFVGPGRSISATRGSQAVDSYRSVRLKPRNGNSGRNLPFGDVVESPSPGIESISNRTRSHSTSSGPTRRKVSADEKEVRRAASQTEPSVVNFPTPLQSSSTLGDRVSQKAVAASVYRAEVALESLRSVSKQDPIYVPTSGASLRFFGPKEECEVGSNGC